MDIYTLPFSAQEIEEKLNRVDTNTNDITILFNTINTHPTKEDHSKYFIIDNKGYIALKPEYRGAECVYGLSNNEINYSISDNGLKVPGSLNYTLPECLYIPEYIESINVQGIQPRAFANNLAIKTIILHNNITKLSDYLFFGANNLRNIYNTEQIIAVGKGCIAYTLVSSLSLPNLVDGPDDNPNIAKTAFQYASYLQEIDIGKNITKLPDRAFAECISLTTVYGGDAIVLLGQLCFASTRSLKQLNFLNKNTKLGNQAFYNSRISFADWSEDQLITTVKYEYDSKGNPKIANNGVFASPIADNKNYWSNVQLNCTSYESPIYIQFNQLDSRWSNTFLGQTNNTHNTSCGTFSVMHIHSILSQQYYDSPKAFVDELYTNENTRKFVDASLWPNGKSYWLGNFSNTILFFEALGYNYEVLTDYGLTNSEFTSEKYQKMCNALSRGALVFTSCTRSDYQLKGVGSPHQHNSGHVVALYGIHVDKSTQTAEVCVLDSMGKPGEYGDVSLNNMNLCTYTMPYYNFTGPCPGCIIINPIHSQYFDISSEGLISLKSQYRGTGDKNYTYSISNNGYGVKGSSNDSLPSHLYIPTRINGQRVTGFQPGTFINNGKVTNITYNVVNGVELINIPNTIKEEYMEKIEITINEEGADV